MSSFCLVVAVSNTATAKLVLTQFGKGATDMGCFAAGTDHFGIGMKVTFESLRSSCFADEPDLQPGTQRAIKLMELFGVSSRQNACCASELLTSTVSPLLLSDGAELVPSLLCLRCLVPVTKPKFRQHHLCPARIYPSRT